MLKFLPILFSLFFLFHTSSFTLHNSLARTTPEDIVNAKREIYQKMIQNYSEKHQGQLEDLYQKIAGVNKNVTDELSQIMERQGQILEEYIKRSGTDPRYQTDGIHRNLDDKVENARYYLTFAHEAVAFQAAKIYIFELTSEANIKKDALSTISQLQSDLNTLKGKVTKSQNTIKVLVER